MRKPPEPARRLCKPGIAMHGSRDLPTHCREAASFNSKPAAALVIHFAETKGAKWLPMLTQTALKTRAASAIVGTLDENARQRTSSPSRAAKSRSQSVFFCLHEVNAHVIFAIWPEPLNSTALRTRGVQSKTFSELWMARKRRRSCGSSGSSRGWIGFRQTTSRS